MDPLDLSLRQFLNDLAARQPTPGGGSGSALAGALGAALASMAALYTTGREKFKDSEPAAFALDERFRLLRRRLEALIPEDMAAYAGYIAARALPKESPEQKSIRAGALATASETATKVPEAIIAASLEGILAVEELAQIANPALAGDVAAAAYCLEAAARGGAIQVLSNCAAPDKEGLNVLRRKKALEHVQACQAGRERIEKAVKLMLKV